MQNIKYHIVNIIAAIFLSFTAAVTINQFIKFFFAPTYSITTKKSRQDVQQKQAKNFEYYQDILDSTFFMIANIDNKASITPEEETAPSSDLRELQLLGTISGPKAIARALIKQQREKDSQIFRLWSDVYGYKLVRIDNSKVYLKKNDKVDILDMYFKENEETSGNTIKTVVNTPDGAKTSQTISRSEIQQNVLNNIDNALQGVRAGPHTENGKIVGYKLFRVRPSNILYKLGARSGDIAKRINGHPIDSTEKLLSVWQSIKDETNITIDMERNGKIVTYNFTLTD